MGCRILAFGWSCRVLWFELRACDEYPRASEAVERSILDENELALGDRGHRVLSK